MIAKAVTAADAVAACNLPALVSALEPQTSKAEKEEALDHLSVLMERSFDDEAAALCASLRDLDCIGSLCSLLEHPELQVHRLAMFLVGNLVSEARAPNSDLEPAVHPQRHAVAPSPNDGTALLISQ